MPAKKGSKALQNKNNFIGKLAKSKKEISKASQVLEKQYKEIDRLQHKKSYNDKRISDLKKDVENSSNQKEIQSAAFVLSESTRKRRLKKPTTTESSKRIKQSRCSETFSAASIVHGGSSQNTDPTIDGLLLTATSKCHSDRLACKILTSKKSLTKQLTSRCIKQHSKTYYNSDANKNRSLNVYYSQNVMGKMKYVSVRKANKSSDVTNFIPYRKLSEYIQSINIESVKDINPKFTFGLDEDEIGSGMYQDLTDYALRLAEFYLTVNKCRTDKLTNWG